MSSSALRVSALPTMAGQTVLHYMASAQPHYLLAAMRQEGARAIVDV